MVSLTKSNFMFPKFKGYYTNAKQQLMIFVWSSLKIAVLEIHVARNLVFNFLNSLTHRLFLQLDPVLSCFGHVHVKIPV